LKVITIVALILLPVILLYQGWTYHVFRRRLRGAPGPDTASGGAVPTSSEPTT
jgi:cytochrome d ubiquinol oxidase subunit II